MKVKYKAHSKSECYVKYKEHLTLYLETAQKEKVGCKDGCTCATNKAVNYTNYSISDIPVKCVVGCGLA